MNKYDLLLWWRKVLMSCETEDQFKNALNLWPKVKKLSPRINDAWNVVVDAAKDKLNITVELPLVSRCEPRIGIGIIKKISYPKTTYGIIYHVFNQPKPPGAE